MSTHIAIVESLREAVSAGESTVLATVIRVIGSSYGGMGARMVIRVDGSTVGLVSGGCLESDLCAHAVEVHSSGRARVITYDTRADDDAVWGLGLGCNGLIEVLLQPLSPAAASAVADMLGEALSALEPSVIAAVIHSESAMEIGAQLFFGASGWRVTGGRVNEAVLEGARARAADALAAGRPGLYDEIAGARIAFEVIHPAIRLVVCGSGPDVAPLVRFARELGWDVTVVDHRPPAPPGRDRFPGARVLECQDPEALASAVTLTSTTAAVVMSHHFARDTGYVRALLATGVGYLGVLGPRARTERMLAELASDRGAFARDDLLFGPVGLDLGGDGPEAIALAIVAEISAVMHDCIPSHLRDRVTALHHRIAR